MTVPYFISHPFPARTVEVSNIHFSDEKKVILNQSTLGLYLGFMSVCQWFSTGFFHIYVYKSPKCLLLLKLDRKLVGFKVAI